MSNLYLRSESAPLTWNIPSKITNIQCISNVYFDRKHPMTLLLMITHSFPLHKRFNQTTIKMNLSAHVTIEMKAISV